MKSTWDCIHSRLDIVEKKSELVDIPVENIPNETQRIKIFFKKRENNKLNNFKKPNIHVIKLCKEEGH